MHKRNSPSSYMAVNLILARKIQKTRLLLHQLPDAPLSYERYHIFDKTVATVYRIHCSRVLSDGIEHTLFKWRINSLYQSKDNLPEEKEKLFNRMIAAFGI